jgi:hypothetical protein
MPRCLGDQFTIFMTISVPPLLAAIAYRRVYRFPGISFTIQAIILQRLVMYAIFRLFFMALYISSAALFTGATQNLTGDFAILVSTNPGRISVTVIPDFSLFDFWRSPYR